MKLEGGNEKRDNYFRCVRNNKLYSLEICSNNNHKTTDKIKLSVQIYHFVLLIKYTMPYIY